MTSRDVMMRPYILAKINWCLATTRMSLCTNFGDDLLRIADGRELTDRQTDRQTDTQTGKGNILEKIGEFVQVTSRSILYPLL